MLHPADGVEQNEQILPVVLAYLFESRANNVEPVSHRAPRIEDFYLGHYFRALDRANLEMHVFLGRRLKIGLETDSLRADV